MLQNELKQRLKKTQLHKKLALTLAGVCLLLSIGLGILLFTSDSQKINTAGGFQSNSNDGLAIQVKNISQDSVNVLLELSEIEIIQKFDSLAYIIDTLELSLEQAQARAQRDYARYITASNYSTSVETTSLEKGGLDVLIEKAKKYAGTDCKKSLAFLYAAKKVAEIDGTTSVNKNSINQMISKCEGTLFGSSK